MIKTRWVSSRCLLSNTVPIVYNTILYTYKFKRVDLTLSTLTIIKKNWKKWSYTIIKPPGDVDLLWLHLLLLPPNSVSASLASWPFLRAEGALRMLQPLGPLWLWFPLPRMPFPRQLCGSLPSFLRIFFRISPCQWGRQCLWSSNLKFQCVPCNTCRLSLCSFFFKCPILYLLLTITLKKKNFFFWPASPTRTYAPRGQELVSVLFPAIFHNRSWPVDAQ